jgi:large subunit ribosomal protein L17
MLKALIEHERITTTLPKAKALRGYAERMITLAKKNTLAARRQAISSLMIQYNTLSEKEKRDARAGDTSSYNGDRIVVDKLFDTLGKRFVLRNGGYTRIIKGKCRRGDNAQTCVIEYLSA